MNENRNFPDWPKLRGQPVSLEEMDRLDRQGRMAGNVSAYETSVLADETGVAVVDPGPRGFWAVITGYGDTAGAYTFTEYQEDGVTPPTLIQSIGGLEDATAHEVMFNPNVPADGTEIVWMTPGDGDGIYWRFKYSDPADGTYVSDVTMTLASGVVYLLRGGPTGGPYFDIDRVTVGADGTTATRRIGSTTTLELTGGPVNVTASTTLTVSAGQTWTITGGAGAKLDISVPVLDLDSPLIKYSVALPVWQLPASTTVTTTGVAGGSATTSATTNGSGSLIEVAVGTTGTAVPTTNLYTNTLNVGGSPTVNLTTNVTFALTGGTTTSFTGTSSTYTNSVGTQTRSATTFTETIQASGTKTVTGPNAASPQETTTVAATGKLSKIETGTPSVPVPDLNRSAVNFAETIGVSGTWTLTSTGTTGSVVATANPSGVIVSLITGSPSNPISDVSTYAAAFTLGSGTAGALLKLLEPSSSGTNTVSLQAPALAGNTPYTAPDAYPVADGYALTSTTTGTMSWQPMTGTGTVTGTGTADQVAYWDDTDDITGDANFTWSGAQLSVTGAANASETPAVVAQIGTDYVAKLCIDQTGGDGKAARFEAGNYIARICEKNNGADDFAARFQDGAGNTITFADGTYAMTIGDGCNVKLGTSTGTKWGGASDKQGWFGHAPAALQTVSGLLASATTVADLKGVIQSLMAALAAAYGLVVDGTS